MKYRLVAVIEPKDAKYQELKKGLERAGLKVTAAREALALTREQLVVLGPSVKSASRVVQAAKRAVPAALVFAAMSKGFKAAWADAVLPLPISANDLKARLDD